MSELVKKSWSWQVFKLITQLELKTERNDLAVGIYKVCAIEIE